MYFDFRLFGFFLVSGCQSTQNCHKKIGVHVGKMNLYALFSFSFFLLLMSSTVALVNSQVVLKGIESEGCVLVAAGNARILKRLHAPVWSNGEMFNKGTWVGKVENLQVRELLPFVAPKNSRKGGIAGFKSKLMIAVALSVMLEAKAADVSWHMRTTSTQRIRYFPGVAVL